MATKIKGKSSRKKHANFKSASKRGLSTAQNETKTTQIAINSPEFKDLQSSWYNKLADDGFKDLERTPQGRFTESGLLNGMSNRALSDKYNTETRHFYAKLRNFLTHNDTFLDQFGLPLSNKRLKACQLASDGAPYRSILKTINKMKGPPLNLWSLSQLINHFISISNTWNKKSFNGLDYEADL